MVNFIYHFSNEQFTCDYRITQFRMGAAFEVYSMNDVLIGSILKGSGRWEQYSGRQMLQEMVDAFGKHIDDNGLWS